MTCCRRRRGRCRSRGIPTGRIWLFGRLAGWSLRLISLSPGSRRYGWIRRTGSGRLPRGRRLRSRRISWVGSRGMVGSLSLLVCDCACSDVRRDPVWLCNSHGPRVRSPDQQSRLSHISPSAIARPGGSRTLCPGYGYNAPRPGRRSPHAHSPLHGRHELHLR